MNQIGGTRNLDGRRHRGSLNHACDDRIAELRQQQDPPLSIRAIAAHVGVSENTVSNVIRRRGLQGKRAAYQVNPKALKPRPTLEIALDDYGGLYLERATVDGRPGYLVTIRDEIPGCACETLAGAIKSAMVAIGDREAAQGGPR